MILSWNYHRMPPQGDVLLCRKLAVNFYENGNYLGPVTWLNMQTGECERYVKELGEYVVDDKGFRQIERFTVDLKNLKIHRRGVSGIDLEEVDMNYFLAFAA